MIAASRWFMFGIGADEPGLFARDANDIR